MAGLSLNPVLFHLSGVSAANAFSTMRFPYAFLQRLSFSAHFDCLALRSVALRLLPLSSAAFQPGFLFDLAFARVSYDSYKRKGQANRGIIPPISGIFARLYHLTDSH